MPISTMAGTPFANKKTQISPTAKMDKAAASAKTTRAAPSFRKVLFIYFTSPQLVILPEKICLT